MRGTGKTAGRPAAVPAAGYATPLTPVTGDSGDDMPSGESPAHHTPLASAPSPLDAPPSEGEGEATPAYIGRFKVLRRLGEGGMGVVYAAWDETLNRKLALKVLRTRVGVNKRESGRKRLQREAQAMAKLSHPNVVAIYDVGMVGDQVFLAMEFVRGETLTKWMQAARRTWHEVLAVYMQAGRGLAAAHRAGIVHRDFKPDNVLIDGEGRVRVVDFGLARAGGGSGVYVRPDTYADAIKSIPANSMLDARITRTGGMTGTPAYMAPEQYLGKPTDARTDQFSFCVALYEGLYGQRPFLGDRVAVVREAVLGGQIQAVPRDTDVPQWLRRILTRGLAVRPGDRYSDMDELMAHLADTPAPPTRQRWLWIGGLAVAVVSVLVAREVTLRLGRSVAPAAALALCSSEALAGVWDDGRRAQLRAAFVTSEAPKAAAEAERIARALDEYSATWRSLAAATCTEAQRGASGLESQAACLRRRAGALRSLGEVLLRADARAVERGLAATWALPPVSLCADAKTVGWWQHSDERRVLELDRAAIHGALGDWSSALVSARAVVRNARDGGDVALQAQSLALQARLEHSSGDLAAAERSARDSLQAAEASNHDGLVVDAQTVLLSVLDALGHDAEAISVWQQLGERLARSGDDQRRESLALHAVGKFLLQRARHAEAATQLALALRLGERSLGLTHPHVGMVRVDLALAQARLGAHDEAARQLDQALALLSDALPEDDPAVVRAYLARAEVLRRRGRWSAAAADYARAEAALVETRATDIEALAESQLGLGHVAVAQQRWAAAELGFLRALGLRERLRGSDSVDLVEPLLGLCVTATERGQHTVAVKYGQRALTLAASPGYLPGPGAARVAVAQALWGQAVRSGPPAPTLRAEIISLARTGLTELQRSPQPDSEAVARAAQWLASRNDE